MSFTISKEEAEAAVTNSPDIELREQDRWLPIANVARLMKCTLPATAKVSKDAKECMQECVSEFISFITSEASDKCLRDKRKTINGEDILYSMHDLGFENYAEVLKIYLAKYREQQALKQERGETKMSKKQLKKREALLQEEEAFMKSEQEASEHGSENPELHSAENPEDEHQVQDQASLSSLKYEGQEHHDQSPDYFHQYNADDRHNGDSEHADINLKNDLEVDVHLNQGHIMEDERYNEFIDGQGGELQEEKENGKGHARSDSGESLGKLAEHNDIELSMADRDYY